MICISALGRPRYRRAELELAVGRDMKSVVLHGQAMALDRHPPIVGGGARNALLNQFTADATGRPVLAGPVEATAIGNLLMQARARGRIGSLADLREIVARSFPVTTYEPGERSAWEDAFGRFGELVGRP